MNCGIAFSGIPANPFSIEKSILPRESERRSCREGSGGRPSGACETGNQMTVLDFNIWILQVVQVTDEVTKNIHKVHDKVERLREVEHKKCSAAELHGRRYHIAVAYVGISLVPMPLRVTSSLCWSFITIYPGLLCLGASSCQGSFGECRQIQN